MFRRAGYEEAAAQGLIAGINAARTALNLPLIALRRESSYIGTLLDDLATKVGQGGHKDTAVRSQSPVKSGKGSK